MYFFLKRIHIFVDTAMVAGFSYCALRVRLATVLWRARGWPVHIRLGHWSPSILLRTDGNQHNKSIMQSNFHTLHNVDLCIIINAQT